MGIANLSAYVYTSFLHFLDFSVFVAMYLLGDKWVSLPPESRVPYIKQSDADKKRFIDETARLEQALRQREHGVKKNKTIPQSHGLPWESTEKVRIWKAV